MVFPRAIRRRYVVELPYPALATATKNTKSDMKIIVQRFSCEWRHMPVYIAWNLCSSCTLMCLKNPRFRKSHMTLVVPLQKTYSKNCTAFMAYIEVILKATIWLTNLVLILSKEQNELPVTEVCWAEESVLKINWVSKNCLSLEWAKSSNQNYSFAQ